LKPGPVPGLGNAQQAPHVAVSIFARGLLQALTTRLYFQDEPLNETDPVLSLIEDEARRRTLIARKVSADTWQLDIRLQGENETVFMEI
jgi:protocatechuate 3,4-dioxygenase, alpha subunit